MKRNIRLVGCFGIFVLLLGFALTLSVAAIDTPWIPWPPDPPAQTTESSTSEKEDGTETSTWEEISGSGESAVPTQNAEESRAKPKKGCRGTVSGTVLLFSLAFTVWIGKKDR